MSHPYSKFINDVLGNHDYYDVVRIVNPVLKTVHVFEKGEWVIEEDHCFLFWSQDEPCLNCTSMRSINQQKSVIKTQRTKDKVYLITSVPATLDTYNVALELLKDITDSYELNDDQIALKQAIDLANELAMKDALTHAFNRRYFDERILTDIVSSQTLHLAFLDIDFFKKVNDTYGHLVGDDTLKMFSAKIKESLRGEDYLVRFGGEEFLIVSKRPYFDFLEGLKQLKDAVQSTAVHAEGATFYITFSAGVSSLSEAKTKEELIALADERVYHAKATGRNKIVTNKKNDTASI